MSLRSRIAFDYPVTAGDGYGGTVSGWSGAPDSYQCRAEMIYWRGLEGEDAGRQVGRERYKVKIRRSAKAMTITTDWRLRDLGNGETYNIRQVDNVTQRGWIFLVVEHGTAP